MLASFHRSADMLSKLHRPVPAPSAKLAYLSAGAMASPAVDIIVDEDPETVRIKNENLEHDRKIFSRLARRAGNAYKNHTIDVDATDDELKKLLRLMKNMKSFVSTMEMMARKTRELAVDRL